jgi:hypothetical protein
MSRNVVYIKYTMGCVQHYISMGPCYLYGMRSGRMIERDNRSVMENSWLEPKEDRVLTRPMERHEIGNDFSNLLHQSAAIFQNIGCLELGTYVGCVEVRLLSHSSVLFRVACNHDVIMNHNGLPIHHTVQKPAYFSKCIWVWTQRFSYIEPSF